MKYFLWPRSGMLAVLAVALLNGTACGLSFNWSFTNSSGGNVAGPVSGTIGFSTLVAGAGGSHVPNSFTIESAPGHSISNGYALGDEVIGDPLWVDITAVPSFVFNAANVAVSGDLAFKDVNNDILLMDFRSPAQNSFFRSPGPPNLITQGAATWTIAIPEPSSLVLGGLLIPFFFLRARSQSSSSEKMKGSGSLRDIGRSNVPGTSFSAESVPFPTRVGGTACSNATLLGEPVVAHGGAQSSSHNGRTSRESTAGVTMSG